MAGSFRVRTLALLPLSIGGDNPLTLFGTLTDLELRLITCYRKEEGWNHEHTRRPFHRDGAFFIGKSLLLMETEIHSIGTFASWKDGVNRESRRRSQSIK
ncbi:hypothetical protein CD33_05060 [Ureibacillus sinduriensis BLB-1 = JCM 15800]|uniref:Uncharacterized protein n=1 Tax=Ureibacillus sinduriensis BLB-1 = JCM 15800 TaxID=1384057 RepID=A0A0A3HWM5_9BACL|nr:hypothetical protein CD33_05060 [Ureibacillus sinduriensis BLB-1 = JCM 15800]